MYSNESSMGYANALSSARSNGQVKRRERGQQWYARPAERSLEGKPCCTNTMGGVTGTRRECESRTLEQGAERRPQRHAIMHVVWETRIPCKKRCPENLPDTRDEPRKTIRDA